MAREQKIMDARYRGQNLILQKWNEVLTKESKQQKIEIVQLRKELEEARELANRYTDFYHQRLNEETYFNSLPWWEKVLYKFNIV